jgi:G3E family GTPase
VTPLTLLTGFLGAGKTTLLNRLLKRPEMAGTAVLINEFGEIGLDHLLVERLDEETVLLNAGCLCCTVRGDLVRALTGLEGRGLPLSRVVVETTGLADPAPILQTLMSDPRLLRRFALDGVVTVVDAMSGAATLDAQQEAVKQAAVADRIVLSKTDLAPPAVTESLAARLAVLNPQAPILRAVAGEIAPEALLAAGPFDPAAKPADVARWLAEETHHHHHHHHAHDPNRHDARIAATSLTYDSPLHWEAVGSFLEMLTRTRGESVLRIKGILDLVGEERPVAVHGVQHVWHPPARLAAWPEGPRRSRLVFITRDLPGEVIRNGLAAFERAAEDQPVRSFTHRM